NEAASFGVPAAATAVVLNVTVAIPSAQGHLTVFPTGAAQPLASNLNYAAGFNVTAVNPAAQDFLTVYPQGGTRPTASNVNYVAGKVSANRVIVPLSA